MRILLVCLVLTVVACGGKGGPTTSDHAKLKGAILGLVRDGNTGDPVGMADLQIIGPTARRTNTNTYGLYTMDGLAAGTYTLKGLFAGQPIEVTNIVVKDGEAVYVDLMFTLGDPQPIKVVFGDHSGEITRYHPKNIQPSAALIEGTLSDVATRERVVGAVVTAAGGGRTEQTITDDHGRYRFENVTPGIYSVSAYYSIGGRAQVEVQRNQIEVAATEAVIVPLSIELAK